jgi:predicted NBD/HSP70 family sugar kinase
MDQKLIALSTIRKFGSITRPDLADQMQISLSLATKITAELIARGLIYETGKSERNNVGRPVRPLALTPEAAFAVGLHMGSAEQIAVVTNLYGDVIAQLSDPIVITEDRDTIVASMKSLIERVIQRAGIPASAVGGVGVALSDIVDPVSGISYGWPDTPGWSAAWALFPVRDALEAVLPFSHVLVDDIVRTLGIAEARYGRGSRESDFVYILADTGLGMAIMMNGTPYIGHSHIAGEIAHIPTGKSTEICGCGNTGCLNLVSGVPVVLKRIRQQLEETPIRSTLRLEKRELTIEDVFQAADDGDKLAIQILTENGENLGEALATIVNLLGPRSIVLGGALSRSAHFVDAAQRSMQKYALGIAARGVTIQRSDVDILGGARGAATQVLDELFTNEGKSILDLARQRAGE